MVNNSISTVDVLVPLLHHDVYLCICCVSLRQPARADSLPPPATAPVGEEAERLYNEIGPSFPPDSSASSCLTPLPTPATPYIHKMKDPQVSASTVRSLIR